MPQSAIKTPQPLSVSAETPAAATVPVLWTSRETADFLKISEKKLERGRWIGDFDLPYVKLGRHVRYRAVDVIEYVERHLVTAGGE